MDDQAPTMTSEQLGTAISRTTAPRVTKEYIEANIARTDYHFLPGNEASPGTRVTICQITLDNGFDVRGDSACVNAANFDAEIGKKIAYDNAFEKLWPLFGFLLAEERRLALSRETNTCDRRPFGLVARACHAANKVYCESIGDLSQVDFDQAPEWQQLSAVRGARFVADNPDAPASANHDAWMADKIADGWVFGAVKDEAAKTHPCIVPYDQLPAAQQFKDSLFRAVALAILNG